MKLQKLELLIAVVFCVAKTASTGSRLIYVGPSEIVQNESYAKRGILSTFCCLVKSTSLPETLSYSNVAKYLKANPEEFIAAYNYVMDDLKDIVLHSNIAVRVLENHQTYSASPPEARQLKLREAVEIWHKKFDILSAIKKHDWDILFTLADPTNTILLKNQREISCERIVYLRFFIWFHSCDSPYDCFSFGEIEKYTYPHCIEAPFTAGCTIKFKPLRALPQDEEINLMPGNSTSTCEASGHCHTHTK